MSDWCAWLDVLSHWIWHVLYHFLLYWTASPCGVLVNCKKLMEKSWTNFERGKTFIAREGLEVLNTAWVFSSLLKVWRSICTIPIPDVTVPLSNIPLTYEFAGGTSQKTIVPSILCNHGLLHSFMGYGPDSFREVISWEYIFFSRM